MRRAVPTALAFLCALLLAESASAVSLEQVGDFDTPAYVTSEPGNAGRLYVVEQEGVIRLVTPNVTTDFVDLRPVVESVRSGGGNEEGLLSVAFPPDFAATGLLYVFYTNQAGNIQISELTSSGNTASPGSQRSIIEIEHPEEDNHNGGQLQFGPDGYLYASIGDGGGSGDPQRDAQNPNSLLGKIIRIDPLPGGGYTVPPDNPFVGVPNAKPEIWSLGLRNPFRFSFDGLSGDLTIADVGQDAREEIDFSPVAAGAGKGLNWGWNCREGFLNYGNQDTCTGTYEPPVLDYARRSPRCAITGGYVVRDPGLTELYGRYVYADYCEGKLRSAVLARPTALDDRAEAPSADLITSFGEDACGRIYVASRGTSADGIGPVFRLVDGTPTDCSAFLPPEPPPEVGECGTVVRGSEGDDELRGGAGSQELLGLRGDDGLRGEDGADCLVGGAGKDALRGGDGRDDLDGGAGGDSFNSRDGTRDRVVCGPGRDRVKADRKDRLRGCERVARRG